MCSNNLNLVIDESTIDRAHRYGRRKEKRPRPLIVKFTKFHAKQNILRHKNQLKGTRIFVNEDITAKNVNFLKTAKEIADVCYRLP